MLIVAPYLEKPARNLAEAVADLAYDVMKENGIKAARALMLHCCAIAAPSYPEYGMLLEATEQYLITKIGARG